MKWGKKWGRDPATGVVSYWGTLKNNVPQAITFVQELEQTGIVANCDTYSTTPALGSTDETVLTYPVVSPSLTLSIRNPKFGNVKIVDDNTLVRKNRGGEVMIYKDPNWPTFHIMRISFEALSDDNIADWKTFFQTSAGLEIGLLDWEGRQWTGQILTNISEIIKAGADDCTYEIAFDFLGVLS